MSLGQSFFKLKRKKKPIKLVVVFTSSTIATNLHLYYFQLLIKDVKTEIECLENKLY